jgi:sigma54-dependent transcription regulator
MRALAAIQIQAAIVDLFGEFCKSYRPDHVRASRKFLDEAKIYIRSGDSGTAAWRSGGRNSSTSAGRAATTAARRGRVTIEKSDHRHRLLRPCRQRPGCRRTAEEARNEWDG